MPSTQFMALPAEKQAEIVRAGLEVFAEHGYDAASTNEIVRRAGISKGVLFKYFADKETFFLYVAHVSAGLYLNGMPRLPDADLFAWIRAVTSYKLNVLREDPATYRLWMRMTQHPGHPVHVKVMAREAERAREVAVAEGDLFSVRGLRPGITRVHVGNLLGFIATGLLEKFAAMLPETVDEGLDAAFDAVVSEFDEYLDIVKHGLYFREEEQR